MSDLKGLHLSSALSNAEYHGDNTHYSSSQIKTAIQDIELFYKSYVSNEIVTKNVETPAMKLGTYLHTAILEPDTMEEECAVYEGQKRSGKAWKEFEEARPGKCIITLPELEKVEVMIKAAKESPRLMELLVGGSPELSLFHQLNGIDVKVRADYINIEKGYIFDLKSTAKNAKNEFEMQSAVSSFNYDMSAAFYLDTFNDYLRSEGAQEIDTFYWGFVSKTCSNAKVWAASEKMLATGRAKYMNGINQILKFSSLGWEFPDEVTDLNPLPWDSDLWLKGKGIDKRVRTDNKPIRNKKKSDLL